MIKQFQVKVKHIILFITYITIFYVLEMNNIWRNRATSKHCHRNGCRKISASYCKANLLAISYCYKMFHCPMILMWKDNSLKYKQSSIGATKANERRKNLHRQNCEILRKLKLHLFSKNIFIFELLRIFIYQQLTYQQSNF